MDDANSDDLLRRALIEPDDSAAVVVTLPSPTGSRVGS